MSSHSILSEICRYQVYWHTLSGYKITLNDVFSFRLLSRCAFFHKDFFNVSFKLFLLVKLWAGKLFRKGFLQAGLCAFGSRFWSWINVYLYTVCYTRPSSLGILSIKLKMIISNKTANWLHFCWYTGVWNRTGWIEITVYGLSYTVYGFWVRFEKHFRFRSI